MSVRHTFSLAPPSILFAPFASFVPFDAYFPSPRPHSSSPPSLPSSPSTRKMHFPPPRRPLRFVPSPTCMHAIWYGCGLYRHPTRILAGGCSNAAPDPWGCCSTPLPWQPSHTVSALALRRIYRIQMRGVQRSIRSIGSRGWLQCSVGPIRS